MAWHVPKTDWISQDYFNLEDWNRINENFQYLANKLSIAFEILDTSLPDMMSLPYYNIVNNLEVNLDNLAKTPDTVFPFEKATWHPRTSEQYERNPSYLDFNRWESLELALKVYNDKMSSQLNNLHSGAFTSGSNRLRQYFGRGGK